MRNRVNTDIAHDLESIMSFIIASKRLAKDNLEEALEFRAAQLFLVNSGSNSPWSGQ